jgi:hypothetical protein
MLILPKTTAAIYGYLLREGVVLNLPDEIAERLIQSGHASPMSSLRLRQRDPQTPCKPRPNAPRRRAKP